MQNRDKEVKNIKEQTITQEHLVCYMCGCKIKPEDYSWREDDDGVLCRDCRAERDSCGCSD